MTSSETPELISLSWAHREILVPYQDAFLDRQVDVVSIPSTDSGQIFQRNSETRTFQSISN